MKLQQPLTAKEQALLRKASAWPEFLRLDQLDTTTLRQISQKQGLDFATAVLYDRLLKSSDASDCPQDSFTKRTAASISTIQDETGLIAIIPGAFYQETTKFNADGTAILKQAQQLGLEVATIPTKSFGSLDENGTIIRDWLVKHAVPNTVLVSLSKGGADLKWALHQAYNRSQSGSTFRNVSAWINISGICEGTPLVNWLLEKRYRSLLVRPMFLWRSYDFNVVREVGYGPNTLLNCEWRIPSHMKLVHVLGFPLQQHLTCGLARRGHRRLSGFGPNDGSGIVLSDAVRRPGIIMPIWGADHYLCNEQVTLSRAFCSALSWLNKIKLNAESTQIAPEAVS